MKKISLRRKLITLFILTSTVPIILLGLYDLYNMKSVLKANTDFFVEENLERVRDNINIRLDSYDDLLYQIYTNDDMVVWVDNLNNKENVAVTVNQMRRFMRGLFYTKDYVRSITVITEGGDVITYDQLTPATYENSWINNYPMQIEEMYANVSGSKKTVYFDTHYGTTFANDDYYLFHMAHRIVDYKKPYRRNGIVIISIDETLLREIIQSGLDKENEDYSFIVGTNGAVISFPDKSFIGKKITSMACDFYERERVYSEFVEDNINVKPYTTTYSIADEKLGWDIVEPIDQSALSKEMNKKEIVVVIASIILLAMTIIALKDVLLKEKEANDEKRRSEIRALEAQINPHFIYNTLDTINWMAMDRDEFDISNAISSLATILRYAIAKSDEKVTVREEVEWLKKYIYLQQYRLKNKFVCNVEISPDVMDIKIHKLLLQPFVENAIIHGFAQKQDEYILTVRMGRGDDKLNVTIEDNGAGIDEETLAKLNNKEAIEDKARNHVGVKNALSRLSMYYEQKENVLIESKLGEGTTITISIPI